VTDGGRGALSNNILGARPHHPFYSRLTQALLPYNWRWPLPYITIMYASGQWFETAIWQEYHALLPKPDAAGSSPPPYEHRLYRIMMDGRPGADPWVFFSHQEGGGGTWNNWDNAMLGAIGDHVLLFLAVLFGVIGLAGWLGFRCVRRLRTRGYRKLASRPDSHVL
jgi:hypothetical protein